jgi:hypothetical protein
LAERLGELSPAEREILARAAPVLEKLSLEKLSRT